MIVPPVSGQMDEGDVTDTRLVTGQRRHYDMHTYDTGPAVAFMTHIMAMTHETSHITSGHARTQHLHNSRSAQPLACFTFLFHILRKRTTLEASSIAPEQDNLTMRSISLLNALGVSSLATNANALSNSKAPASTMNRVPSPPQTEPVFGRRRALESILFGVFATATTSSAAYALDMEAFASSTLENDQKNCDPKKDPKCMPKLTADQALCKYGESGANRGEACKRAKAAGGSK